MISDEKGLASSVQFCPVFPPLQHIPCEPACGAEPMPGSSRQGPYPLPWSLAAGDTLSGPRETQASRMTQSRLLRQQAHSSRRGGAGVAPKPAQQIQPTRLRLDTLTCPTSS
ncbi:hypothetical protein GHT09_003114 [Marmota monax]|uniref:Uncharacterized protein n=1 Tax=Marmota monax TaxID=9995 RepID=A0A834V839_MARMO|nr:hypothetical protein GHT09_003114 [Marmota monax]